jgi:hypothetical protein
VIEADARGEVVAAIDRTIDGVEFTTYGEVAAKG